MIFTKEMVDDLADKLLIGLTDSENDLVLSEFSLIDENINLINSINGIENVECMTHPIDNFVCEMRDDVVEESTCIDDILSNCDDYSSREVSICKVVV